MPARSPLWLNWLELLWSKLQVPTVSSIQFGSGRTALVAVLLRSCGQARSKSFSSRLQSRRTVFR